MESMIRKSRDCRNSRGEPGLEARRGEPVQEIARAPLRQAVEEGEAARGIEQVGEVIRPVAEDLETIRKSTGQAKA